MEWMCYHVVYNVILSIEAAGVLRESFAVATYGSKLNDCTNFGVVSCIRPITSLIKWPEPSLFQIPFKALLVI